MSDKNPEVAVQTRGGGYPLPPVPHRQRTFRCGRGREGRRRRSPDLRRRRPRDEPPVARAGRFDRGCVRHGGHAPPRRERRSTGRPAPEIEELLHDPRVLAVGECGLDFFRMHSPREDQERAFRAQIALSNDTGKPLVVHVRDAWPDVLRVLDEGSAERVVIHCFSGDADIARECAARGYWVSFAGNVTYPKNEHFRQAAMALDARSHPRRDRQSVPRAADDARSRQRTGERHDDDRRDRARARRRVDDDRRSDRDERARSVRRTHVTNAAETTENAREPPSYPPNGRSVSRLQ